ncbi:ATP-binding protein [Cryptosporangium phraense]|uniref:ATP-binding protein n=1 Tax=Cryptosporangium phraense TaxID=2593070 RepID=A0A545AZE5_9ACTN|nr:ATP-binding protein [Cryptosporangium phraense]TQS46710.1 hypothetical protein FL583_00045 [Cryptosporangium phraense]
MSILIAAPASTTPIEKARIFKPFAKEVISGVCRVEELETIPAGGLNWEYRAHSPTPLTIRCHADDTPLRKDSLTSFYGDFALARQSHPERIAILLAIDEVPADPIGGPRAQYNVIRQQSSNENFRFYDAEDMLEAVARQKRILPIDQLKRWVEEKAGLNVIRIDLVLGQALRFWAVEVDSSLHRYLICDPLGVLLKTDAIERLPWIEIQSVLPALQYASVGNEKYTSLAAPVAPLIRGKSESIDDGLFAILDSNRRLRQQVETIVSAGRRALCAERRDAVCIDFERLALTMFSGISSREALDRAEEFEPPTSDEHRVAMAVTAVRLAALWYSSKWIHNRNWKSVGSLPAFIERLVESVNFDSTWADSLPLVVSNIDSAVTAISDPQHAPSTGARPVGQLHVTAALCIHLAAAFGPYCEQYRSALHHQVLPDTVPDLNDSPTFESCWIEHDLQLLKIVVEAPNPRVHRLVTTNRSLIQTALERAEDVLGRSDSQLPFTRVQPLVQRANFEVVDCYFELESEHILKIFMGEELYGNKDVWVRELLQNAIDATLLRKVLLGERDYRPKVTIVHSRRDREVRVHDNGIGMSLYHVRKFFSKVGRSYYRSPELEDELRSRSRTFSPISKFGVGFLSVFMAATSARITTFHAADDGPREGLDIYIPGLMEDFYLQRIPSAAPGTLISLELKDELQESISKLVHRHFLCPVVDISIIDDDAQEHIPANATPPIVPTIVPSGAWRSSVELIEVEIEGRGYSGTVCIAVPKVGPSSGERRGEFFWQNSPDNRIALAQAGIWVKDDNKIFGERRGHGETYHAYFRRIYGLINFDADVLKLNVSRNEFMLDSNSQNKLKSDLITKTTAALKRHLIDAVDKIPNPRERSDYLRSAIFGAVEDGQQFYYTPARTPASNYSYSNSDVLTDAMADVYGQHVLLDQLTSTERRNQTLSDVLARGAGAHNVRVFYTKIQDINADPLFAAWLSEQRIDTKVFFTRTIREAALLLRSARRLGYQRDIAELDAAQLQQAIHYEIVPSGIDFYLHASAGIAEFGDYKPTTAIVIVPISKKTVSRGRGAAMLRADCSEAPYVLIDRQHWLGDFLVRVAEVASGTPSLRPQLREFCSLLVQTVALGNTAEIRREGLQSANNWLSRIYTLIESSIQVGDWSVVQQRKMLEMSDTVGSRKRSS